jgi:multisubunit Na+/H+ antiporter MnhC subunit
MSGIFPQTPLDLDRFYVANHADPAYIAFLLTGIAITLLTISILVILALREKPSEFPSDQANL